MIFFIEPNERLKHASLMDGALLSAQNGMQWTARALRDTHNELFGEKCPHCSDVFFRTLEHIATHDSTTLFDAQDRPTGPTGVQWEHLVVNTFPHGYMIPLHNLPHDLHEEIVQRLQWKQANP